ncbi:hypothetical protein LOTGIDRAFT_155300 [Lottia gigantea]|uniref:Ig-like domain-containing protein n=1 Tax=Lottia gigantea TaxID=225164 RepID=V3ZNE9_LOTGI|nr:hypothetical protein LOTGIDRAFT_155300 [Lottia gigantea]ESO83990.1 hypothetical protein LOTGIDRAFT_155300 [Lottia gigantea]
MHLFSIVFDPGIEDWKSIEEVSPFSVDKHDPLTLTCDNIPRSLPAGQYSWYKQDESGDQVKESSRIAIDRKGSLHFVYIDMEDNLKGGEYKCSVSNRMLEEIKLGSPKRFYVEERKVEDKAPSLLFNGTDDYTVIGRSDVLECIFSGYPAPEIRWFDKEYKPITANEKYKIEKWGRMLTIENVQEEDEGYYRCIGENYIDKVESTVYLNVSSKPIFLNNNDEAIKVSNNTMIMNCSTRSADGESPSDPPIWLENGEYLPPDKLDSGKYELKQDYMELFVYNLTKPDDFRCFQCIVSNSIGVNYRTFCFTGNTTSDNVQSYGAQFEIASTRPILNRSSDVVSQINLALLMCVIFGVMVLFVVAGILSLVVFRRRRLKANKIQHNEFYTEVKQSEYGVDTNRRFSW